jgi:ribosome-binding protein aMBF1 (putative translation factor)
MHRGARLRGPYVEARLVSWQSDTAAGRERVMLAQAFGGTLRALRIKAGLSQGELATRCRLSALIIGEAERGDTEPRLSLILIVRDGLGCSTEALIGDLPTPQERGRS